PFLALATDNGQSTTKILRPAIYFPTSSQQAPSIWQPSVTLKSPLDRHPLEGKESESALDPDIPYRWLDGMVDQGHRNGPHPPAHRRLDSLEGGQPSTPPKRLMKRLMEGTSHNLATVPSPTIDQYKP
ncbi:MAG: hypothetical protein ACK53L_09145, partial [Pirellulaceae bacterium]